MRAFHANGFPPRAPGVILGGRAAVCGPQERLFSVASELVGQKPHAIVVKFVTGDCSRINKVPQPKKCNWLIIGRIKCVLSR